MSLIKPNKYDDLNYIASIYKAFLTDPKVITDVIMVEYFLNLMYKTYKIQDSLKKVKIIRKKKNV